MRGHQRRAAVVAAVGVCCALAAAAPADAASPTSPPPARPDYGSPPAPSPQLQPRANPIGPDEPTVRTNVDCVKAKPDAGGEISQAPWAQRQLRFENAWPLSTGAGVRVAVIDTGVNAHPRLGNRVQAGGDYVSNTTGTADCDGHGTIVAGIIAASADPTERTAFTGLAPDATIISIRQSSKYYTKAVKQIEGDDAGYGNLNTLARSVVRAVDLDAKVINISEAACAPAAKGLADGPLGAALKYAADRDVVVVAAAGNTGRAAAGACQNKNDTAASQPGVAGSSAVSTVASPAWYRDYVLTVGSMSRDGRPSDFSLAGPWVGIAGPGEDITSLDPAPGASGLTNRLAEPPGLALAPIQGTSFATPYVSGAAALVRARFPSMTAKQVIERLKTTARPAPGGWSPAVGYGMVDPVAAVSYVLPIGVSPQAADTHTAPVAAPIPPPPEDTTARTVAFAGSAAALAAVLVTFAVLDALRRHRRRR